MAFQTFAALVFLFIAQTVFSISTPSSTAPTRTSIFGRAREDDWIVFDWVDDPIETPAEVFNPGVNMSPIEDPRAVVRAAMHEAVEQATIAREVLRRPGVRDTVEFRLMFGDQPQNMVEQMIGKFKGLLVLDDTC
jgi:hypothetical protein